MSEPRGLARATVIAVDDPDQLGRVQLQIPSVGEEGVSQWAPMVAPSAGAGRGVSFAPEIGDEVIVGFEDGRMDSPFVLGGLWSAAAPPPTAGAAKWVIRGASGHTVGFDNSERGALTIEDGRGNQIILADGVVTIKSLGELRLKGEVIVLETPSGARTVTPSDDPI